MSDAAAQQYSHLERRPQRPIVELLTLAAPTVAQMASYTVLQFTDTWMLSRVGSVEATAAGNGGMLSFSFIGFGTGLLMLVNTLVSQNVGRREYAACGRYLWQGVWFSVLFALAMLPMLMFADRPFVWSHHEPELTRLEAIFFRIQIAGAVLKLASTAFGQFLIAVNRPGLVFTAAITSVLSNIALAWILIFGFGKIPAFGLVGAATATNIALSIELIILVIFTFRASIRLPFNVADWKLRRTEMFTLLRYGFPAGAQFIADILAWSLFMMTVMGVFGTVVMAANVYAFRFWIVSFMPAFGIAAAVTALVGRYIGMGRPDIAERRAHLGFVVCAIWMLSCGVFFFVARYRLIGMFTNDPEILRVGSTLLIFAAIYQFFDAMYILYSGALRGAGDTLVPAIAVFVLCWGIVVVGGYIVARRFTAFGPAGPWMMATGYGAILGTFIFARFKRGRWKLIRMEKSSASNLPQPSATLVAVTNDR